MPRNLNHQPTCKQPQCHIVVQPGEVYCSEHQPRLCAYPECSATPLDTGTLCQKHQEESDRLVVEQEAFAKEQARVYTIGEDNTVLTKRDNSLSAMVAARIELGCLILPLPKNVDIAIDEEDRKELETTVVLNIMKDGVKGNSSLQNNIKRWEDHLYQLIDSINKTYQANNYMLGKGEKGGNKGQSKAAIVADTKLASIKAMPETVLRQWAASIPGMRDGLPLSELQQQMVNYI